MNLVSGSSYLMRDDQRISKPFGSDLVPNILDPEQTHRVTEGGHEGLKKRWVVGINQSLLLVYIDSAIPLGSSSSYLLSGILCGSMKERAWLNTHLL